MLGLDTETQQRWRQEEKKESIEERRLRELAKEIESNSISVAPDDGKDVSNLLSQMGRPMTAEQIQTKLKICNPRLYFERSINFPELTGVYLITDELEPDIANKTYKRKLKHLFGMESAISPEFSVLHKGKKKIANKEIFGKNVGRGEVKWEEVETFVAETRGWRTILVRLLHAGLITRRDVEIHFGWTPSRDSLKWFKATN